MGSAAVFRVSNSSLLMTVSAAPGSQRYSTMVLFKSMLPWMAYTDSLAGFVKVCIEQLSFDGPFDLDLSAGDTLICGGGRV